MSKRIVAQDLGGSEIREMTSNGQVYKYTTLTREIITDSINNFNNNKYDEFEVVNCPFKSLVGRRFVKGESITDYIGRDIYCDNQSYKVEQEATWLSMIYGIAREVICMEVNSIKTDIKVGICIPAKEFYSNMSKSFKDKLTGEYTINFLRVNKEVKFTLSEDSVSLMSEGVVVFIAQFKANQKLRATLMQPTLIVDIGHRSTEIIFVLNGKPLAASITTDSCGGATLLASISNILANSNQIDVDPLQALLTGTIIQGNQVMNATSAVSIAKQILSNRIAEAIKKVATNTPEIKNIKNIKNFMGIGRCFENKHNTGNLADLLQGDLGVNFNIISVPDLETANITSTFTIMR